MSVTRIDPAIPLQTSRGPGVAHFLDDCGDEREAMWVVFLETGQIWWVPNSQVRACQNFSLKRYNPEVPTMAKKMTMKKWEGSKADERKDRREAKKHGMSEKKWEGSKADRKMDKAAVKKANRRK